MPLSVMLLFILDQRIASSLRSKITEITVLTKCEEKSYPVKSQAHRLLKLEIWPTAVLSEV